MTAEAFLDTNILLYAVSHHPDEAATSQRARALLRQPALGLSVQVLQEFYVISTGKMAKSISPSSARKMLDWLSTLPVVPVDTQLFREALLVKQRCRISYWDAAIIAAAHRLKCRIVYSQDLNHGQHYGKVKVVNPFKSLS